MHPIHALNCEEVSLCNKSERAVARLYEQLYHFSEQYYVLQTQQWFQSRILFCDLPGYFFLYTIGDRLVGFTRLASRQIHIEGQQYITYFGGTYHDPAIQVSLSAARICFIRALQYKLFQPNEKLVYFVNAYHPQRYAFTRDLSQLVEPTPDGQVSDVVGRLMGELCRENDWRQDQDNPLLIKEVMPLKPVWQTVDANSLSPFFHLNPSYLKGDCLYMYLPLDMQTLGHVLNRSVTDRHVIGRLVEHAERSV